MKQQITIMDEKNNKVGMTFQRRAKQLVSKDKARWLDDDQTAIGLIPTKFEEEDTLEMYSTSFNEQNQEEIIKAATHKKYIFVDTPTTMDEDLYKMAKQAVQDRFKLLFHWGLFGVSQIVFIALDSSFFMFIDAIWFAAILMHTIYYFIKATPAKVIKEYNKLIKKIKRTQN